MKEYVKNLLLSLKFSFKSSPKYFFIKIIINLVQSFITIIYTYIFSKIILLIEFKSEELDKLLYYIIILILVFIIQKFIPNIQLYIESRYYDYTCFYLEKIMINKMKNIEQLCYEESSFRDKIRLIRSKFSSIFSVGWTTINLVTAFISIFYVCIIMLKFHVGIFFLAVLISILSAFIARSMVSKQEKYEEKIQLPLRKFSYFKGLFEDKIYNFEIRMFNNNEFFYEKIKKEKRCYYKKRKKIENISDFGDLIISLMNVILYVSVIIVSIVEYNKGIISIALISYYVGIINSFKSYNENFSICLNQFIYENTNIRIINDFLNDKTIYENNSGIILENKNPKIEFLNVWFKYPKNDEFVLKNCSFCFNPTDKVFLIGKNGSGKSTIIKLLFGFYKINEGKILIDDIEIEHYNINSIRKIMGVLFQDYISYSLPFREIIGLSNCKNINNDVEITKVCEKSGIQKLVNTWEKGYDTILGTYYGDNGVFMSGGQWQLTSLSRTYFSNSNFYVLDEPSAALDIFSEDKIFKEFYSNNTDNVIAISHMIANSINATKIFVLENGYIVECGNHVELLKNNLLYKKWYEIQLSRYIKK